MQKTYLFSLQIGMPQANALNSIGNKDTVLFLTIGKSDIYQLKSLGTVHAQIRCRSLKKDNLKIGKKICILVF
jgi:hypothetical protein